MVTSYFSGPTLDDVMHDVIEEILSRGEQIYPTKGGPNGALEIAGVLLEISNPRARLSRTETRGRIFSALGELLWYLSGSNEVDFIAYYVEKYAELAEDGKIFGGYGPRLLSWRGVESWKGVDQISNITRILKTKKDSRKSVIQLFDSTDLAAKHKDVPCTCTLQFMLRNGKLHLFTNMRSNDVYLGLPHDVFCFTMLQEIIANSVGADVGLYKHAVGSMHLYVKDKGPAKRFLKEGFQRTTAVMQPMPKGDPWPEITRVLAAEAAIRTGGSTPAASTTGMDPYWADLVRLLQVFAAKRRKDIAEIKEIAANMSNQVYVKYIDRVIRKLAAASPTIPSDGKTEQGA
jgi:thymidylate synthase